jgi:hypothetical protein
MCLSRSPKSAGIEAVEPLLVASPLAHQLVNRPKPQHSGNGPSTVHRSRGKETSSDSSCNFGHVGKTAFKCRVRPPHALVWYR